MKRRTDDPDYKTKFSKKWRAVNRTTRRLQDDGYIVIRMAHEQKRSKNGFPKELTLMALKRSHYRLIAVHSGGTFPINRKRSLREFAKKNDFIRFGGGSPRPFEVEVWTWPTMGREPKIEILA